MKRIFFVILMTVFCANVSFAQVAETVQNQETAEALTAEDSNINKIVPFMKYRTLKNIYNYKDYVKSDINKYSVGGCSVASFFIPGLGQMICNEVGRGFAWFGGSMASYIVMGIGAGLEQGGETYHETNLQNTGTALMLVGLASMLTVDICAIVDAVRVAKVKNMYENDLVKKYTFDVDLYPSVNCIETAGGIQPTAGLTFALKF